MISVFFVTCRYSYSCSDLGHTHRETPLRKGIGPQCRLVSEYVWVCVGECVGRTHVCFRSVFC